MQAHRNTMTSSREICRLVDTIVGAQNAGDKTVRYMAACAIPDSSEFVFGWRIIRPSQTEHAIRQGRGEKPGPRGACRLLCAMAPHANSAITNAAIRVNSRSTDTPGTNSRAGMNDCDTRNHSSQPHAGRAAGKARPIEP